MSIRVKLITYIDTMQGIIEEEIVQIRDAYRDRD